MEKNKGIIEVFPHACFTTLLGFVPSKTSLPVAESLPIISSAKIYLRYGRSKPGLLFF